VSPTRSSADRVWSDGDGGQGTNSRFTLDLALAKYTTTVTTPALEDEGEGAPYTPRIRSPDFPAGNADANRNCPEDRATAGRIVARRFVDGSIEFGWHVEDGDRVLPACATCPRTRRPAEGSAPRISSSKAPLSARSTSEPTLRPAASSSLSRPLAESASCHARATSQTAWRPESGCRTASSSRAVARKRAPAAPRRSRRSGRRHRTACGGAVAAALARRVCRCLRAWIFSGSSVGGDAC